MANPTTNFGWVMPTSSSLVTNLPADFNTFGQAVDTSMSELLGGTTGQVLSKTSNTNMDFTWITPTDQTPLTTKGDLFTFTTVDARLAVGNNGETLVADSSTATGLRYQGNYAAGKNAIINGAFDVWQRGTTFNSPSGTYCADRFAFAVSGGSGTPTVTQQTFTAGTAPVSGYEGTYFARINTATSATYFEASQKIENVRTFAGQTMTFSFWAKASSSTNATILIRQNFGSGGSANVDTPSNVTFTTSWQRFTLTVNPLGSMTGKTIGANSYLMAAFYAPSAPTSGTTIDTWGWQVEASAVATAFQTATGTLQGELAACQRYYYRITPNGVYSAFPSQGAASSTTLAYIQVTAKQTMRVFPTSVEYSGLRLYDLQSGSTITNLVLDSQSTKDAPQMEVTSSGLTQYRPYVLSANNNANAYIAYSSEL